MDSIILVTPGKIGLTLSIDKTLGGATITKVDPTCRFKEQLSVGDRIVTIDGFRITKIADLQLNKDKVRRFGIVRKALPAATVAVDSSSTPSVVAAKDKVSTPRTTNEATIHPTTAPPRPTAAPKQKTTRSAASKEKRLKRFRSSPTVKIQERIERALQQRLFLIDASTVSTNLHEGGSSITLSVLGSTGNVYEVTIQKVPHCSCPDAAKGNLCKHLLFVMLKVVGLPAHDQLVYQSAYLTDEVEKIIALLQTRLQSLGRDVVANEQVQKVHADMKKGIKSDDDESNTVPRKDIDGQDCPICFDDLGSNLSQLTYCKGTCGTNYHKGCIQMWTRQSARSGPTCPSCRQPWIDVATGGKSKKDAASPSRSEGYDNLGRLQGQSSVRDTSTYSTYSPSYYGYKRRRYY
jgi:plasmid maintenance system killer protein